MRHRGERPKRRKTGVHASGAALTMEAVTISGQAIPRLMAVGDSAGLDPACLLPVVVGIDDTDTPGDMLDALALAPFVAGKQPYARTAHGLARKARCGC